MDEQNLGAGEVFIRELRGRNTIADSWPRVKEGIFFPEKAHKRRDDQEGVLYVPDHLLLRRCFIVMH